MEVYSAPGVKGAWPPVSEPVTEFEGSYQMTIPAPLSTPLRMFRLQEAAGQ